MADEKLFEAVKLFERSSWRGEWHTDAPSYGVYLRRDSHCLCNGLTKFEADGLAELLSDNVKYYEKIRDARLSREEAHAKCAAKEATLAEQIAEQRDPLAGMTTLPLRSVEEHNKQRRAEREAKELAAKKTGVACPSCGKELEWTGWDIRQPTLAYASCPSCKYSYALET